MTTSQNIDDEAKLLKATEQLASYTKILALATVVLVIATIFLAVVAILDYRYIPPDVSIIDSSVANVYVYKNGTSDTYLAITGLSAVYNSAQSDDVALVKTKNLMYHRPTLTTTTYPITIYGNGSYSLENYSVKISDEYNIEGNAFSEPIVPGDPPELIPFLITFKHQQMEDTNQSIELSLPDDKLILDVIHPIQKNILYSLNLISPTNISYTLNEEHAVVYKGNDTSYFVSVFYTEDKEEFNTAKEQFLRNYGRGSVIKNI